MRFGATGFLFLFLAISMIGNFMDFKFEIYHILKTLLSSAAFFSWFVMETYKWDKQPE